MLDLGGISIVNKGLRYKMIIAYGLMSIIPLLACTYTISAYLFPEYKDLTTMSMVVLISLVISILGFLLAKRIVDATVGLSADAKRIAGGDFNRKISVSGGDELGSLGESINIMKVRIKSDLQELKDYGRSMKEINVEIHKKVLALSGLLQIGEMISSGSAQLDYILEVSIEKLCAVLDNASAVLYMPREAGGDFIVKHSHNLIGSDMSDTVIKRGGRGVLEKALEGRSITKSDGSSKASREMEDFKNKYDIKNVLMVPICSSTMTMGLLVVGNSTDGFRFSQDDIGAVNVFAKHMTIAIESDVLNRLNRELSTRDDLTGLYNKRYILNRLEEEIKRAIFYQRPCSFIALSVDNFGKFREERGDIASEEAIRQVARIIKDCAGPVGCAARTAGHDFGMLLPEKNKREASNIAEEARKKIAAIGSAKDGVTGLTVSVGVSENPIDGAAGEDIFKKAAEGVERAKKPGGNRVVS